MKRSLIAAAFCIAAGPSMAAGTSFFDDFDKLDPGRWYVSDGWTNGAHMNCSWTSDQVKVIDGTLVVGFTKASAAQGRDYRCGEVRTKASFTYGTYEARVKTSLAAAGLNAAFFTYTGPPNPHDEIDFEMLLKAPGQVHTTSFVDAKSGNGEEVALPNAIDGDFINLAIVWSPDSVSWYANGTLLRTVADRVPLRDQQIFFSLWGTDTLVEWMGEFVDPGQPITMSVEWAAYTAPGERCLFPQSVTC